MHRIVPGIASLEKYLHTLTINPEAYRPAQCAQCGRGRLWGHGFYERKADRSTRELNPIPVPRFWCPGCKHTCSRLPACRWASRCARAPQMDSRAHQRRKQVLRTDQVECGHLGVYEQRNLIRLRP